MSRRDPFGPKYSLELAWIRIAAQGGLEFRGSRER